MGRVYQQTDTAGAIASGVSCSTGTTVAALPGNREVSVSGVAGVTTSAVGTASAPQTDNIVVIFQSAALEPNLTEWQGGEWTVRIRVSSSGAGPNANFKWSDTWICRVTPGGVVVDTVGARRLPVGDRIDFGTAGVKSMTVDGQPQPIVAVQNRFYIVCVFQIEGAGIQRFGFLPDQLIDTPLETPPFVPVPQGTQVFAKAARVEHARGVAPGAMAVQGAVARVKAAGSAVASATTSARTCAVRAAQGAYRGVRHATGVTARVEGALAVPPHVREAIAKVARVEQAQGV